MARELRSWYTTSAPEIGYRVVESRGGYLAELGDELRFIICVDDPSDVPDALESVAATAGGRPVTIWVDDRNRAAVLDGALVAYGCVREKAITHLALVGSIVTSVSEPPSFRLERVEEEGLADWAVVKLKSFGDTEDQPTVERLDSELTVRRSDLSLAAYELAFLGSEPVGVLGYYHGSDQVVFNLGTRLPYRHRGVATSMLCHWAASAKANGCRSTVINAEEGDRPEALYRRLGFVDEVYWHRLYRLGA